jgi:hypothetical protein
MKNCFLLRILDIIRRVGYCFQPCRGYIIDFVPQSLACSGEHLSAVSRSKGFPNALPRLIACPNGENCCKRCSRFKSFWKIASSNVFKSEHISTGVICRETYVGNGDRELAQIHHSYPKTALLPVFIQERDRNNFNANLVITDCSAKVDYSKDGANKPEADTAKCGNQSDGILVNNHGVEVSKSGIVAKQK